MDKLFCGTVILFAIIFVSHFLRTPEVVPEETILPAKKVTLFTPQNDSIRLTVPAEIKKNSIITVRALTSGVVSGISVSPGQSEEVVKHFLVLRMIMEVAPQEWNEKLPVIMQRYKKKCTISIKKSNLSMSVVSKKTTH